MVLHLVCERVGSRHHSPAPRQNNVAGRGFFVGGEGRSVVFGCLRLCFGRGRFLSTASCGLLGYSSLCLGGFDGGSGYGALVAGMIMIEI